VFFLILHDLHAKEKRNGGFSAGKSPAGRLLKKLFLKAGKNS
jgi:hypothetical protein